MHGQLGVRDARAQARGGPLEPEERGDQRAEQAQDVVGPAVRQLRFRVAPHALVRIELGRIRGKVRDVQAAVRGQQRADRRPAVNLAVVPENQHVARQVPEQRPEKGAGIRRPNVVGRELEVEATATADRAEREPRNDRHALMALPMPEQRRVAARRPGPADRRDQEEARFVDEDEVGPQPRGVFFCRGHARCFHAVIAASSRWSARRSGFCGVHPNRWSRRPT